MGAIVFCMGRNKRPISESTKALAAAIREKQGVRDMSTAELARSSGIPYSTLRKIRAGLVTISFEEMRLVSRGLRISVAELAARAEEIEEEV